MSQPKGALEEVGYDRFMRENLRRNYTGQFIHGVLSMTGFRLLNAPTFIPVYLHSLSGSDVIVGLGAFLQQAGAAVLPMFGASQMEGQKRVLPTAVRLGMGMRIPILLMALAGWLIDGRALLTVMLALLFIYGLSNGAQRVVFQFLMAKVIPIELRGRLQAMRNVAGGLIAAVLAYAAGRWLIEGEVLGNGYSTTFLIAFGLTSLGLIILRLLMIEPDTIGGRGRTRMRESFKEVPRLLRDDRDYRNFVIAQCLAMGGRMAAPFYILHAAHNGHLSGATLGLFSLAFLGADTLSNLAWGYFGDRSGFRSSFVAALVLWIGSTAVLLVSSSPAAYFLAFAGLGAAQSGYLMSATTMVLEFGERQDVALRLGLSTTAEAVMAAIGPLAGGLIAAAAGYPIVFVIAMVLQLIALVALIFGVREPRLKRVSKSEALEREGEGG